MISIVLFLVSIIFGFLEKDCDATMSTWLLVHGFYVFALFAFLLLLGCYLLPFLWLSEEAASAAACLCCLPFFFAILFPLAWLVYGCVLFFPQVSH